MKNYRKDKNNYWKMAKNAVKLKLEKELNASFPNDENSARLDFAMKLETTEKAIEEIFIYAKAKKKLRDLCVARLHRQCEEQNPEKEIDKVEFSKKLEEEMLTPEAKNTLKLLKKAERDKLTDKNSQKMRGSCSNLGALAFFNSNSQGDLSSEGSIVEGQGLSSTPSNETSLAISTTPSEASSSNCI